MINKSVKYSYRGVNKDVAKSKHPFEYYYDAQHIHVISKESQSTGVLANEKGNELIIKIPNVEIDTNKNTITYGAKRLGYKNKGEIDIQINNGILSRKSSNMTILNITNTREGLVIFTTDNSNMDCIWSCEGFVEGDYELRLRYVRNLNFSRNNPIQSLYNYENDNIEKVYWVDGRNQIRFVNISDDNLINLPSNNINFVGNISFSQPQVIDVITGGSHTAGMIQYAYNLYRKNGSQTKISPFTELIDLNKGDNKGGGDVGEEVGSIPVIEIDDIDTAYTHIKVYAIKYTSFNQIPSISLIEEAELNRNTFTIYDDGNVIESLSLEEFVFLGSDPIVPKHIQVKDNRLFPVNIKDKPFLMPEELDFRAYSFTSNNSTTRVLNEPTEDATSTTVSSTYNLNKKSAAINPDFSSFRFQRNSTTPGGSGKYLEYTLRRKNSSSSQGRKLFKDRELYRIGIEFYNSLGQVSPVYWIADFRTDTGNLNNSFISLEVNLNNEFYNYINDKDNFESEDDIPVGYRITRAERNASDKTIISQGIITPMIFQIVDNDVSSYETFYSRLIRQQRQDGALKIPTYLSRTMQRFPNEPVSTNDGILNAVDHLGWLNDRESSSIEEGGEIFTATNRDFKISQTFQYTKMFQLYSPDILFDTNTSFSNNLKLKVLGQCVNTRNGVFGEERLIDTKVKQKGGRTEGGINPWYVDENLYKENNEFRDLFDSGKGRSNGINKKGFISFSGSAQTMDFLQFYREYNDFNYNTATSLYEVYGRPEITETGQGASFYNNDPRYDYANTLVPFVSDGSRGDDGNVDPIQSINSWGAKCATFMLGKLEQSTGLRTNYEKLYADSSLTDPDGILSVEIQKDFFDVYLTSVYGGFSYEDKKRTNYIAIGDYTPISKSSITIDNPGDTFVGNFRFLRIGKTETEVYSNTQIQLSEIVEYPVETSVDLTNRNDFSLTAWDSRFQPRFTEYHSYNRVYSQQSNLIKNREIDFNFDIVKNFDTRIQSTKLKIPNEVIDSWTDILQNETMDLNGKFGPINNVVEYKDNLYTFQDEAIAKISINPRVQIAASEGAAIELGRGGILYDYNYLTTKSGSINKWAIKSTKRGIYYYDALNKGIGRVPDSVDILLSDKKGLHTEFANNYVYNLLKEDNPILKKGVTIGHDNYNNDIYFTFLQGNDLSFTRTFNEGTDEFIDLKTYKPSIYNYKGEKFVSTHNFDEIYLHYAGEYNKFYGEYQPSYIILQVNPESDVETVFNTIQYTSELYLNDIDQPDKTLTHIRAYNEYQDSGRIPLIVGRDNNLRRKFREWNANIPRDRRNRMRNPWIFLKLELDNKSNYKLILHDIIVNYSI